MKKENKGFCLELPCRSFECWFNISPEIILAGAIYGFIAQIIHFLGAQFSMAYYQDPQLAGIWSKLMMSAPDKFNNLYILYSLGISMVIGIIFSSLYFWLSRSFCGQGLEKGLCFGWVLFLLQTIPFVASSFLLFNVPISLAIFWLAESFVINLIGAVEIAFIVKSREVRLHGK